MKRYIRCEANSVDVNDYQKLSSTLKEGGDTFAIFRKRDDGTTKWAAAKYNKDGDLDKAFEITYDQARGFKPLGRVGEISRKLGKKILPEASSVSSRCVAASIDDAEFEDRFKDWRDVYRYWGTTIAEKFCDNEPEKIQEQVDKFYEKYKNHDVVRKAYEKWNETYSMNDYESNMGYDYNSWTDVYEEFNDIADACNYDPDIVQQKIDEFYFKHKDNGYVEEAYRRWCETSEDDVESACGVKSACVESGCVESGCSSKKYTKSSCVESSDNSEENAYVIEFTFDDGSIETGPIIHKGKDLMFATSEDEAVKKWIDEYVDPSDDSFEGAKAHLATDQEVSDLIGIEW